MSAAGGNSDSASVPRAVVAGVFLVALGTLFFEVLLTRIFSVTLWYHFGFLAISLALLGTAASAVLCFLYPDTLAGEKHLRNMAASAAAFAVAAPGSVVYHVVARLPGFDDLNSFYLAFGSQLTLLFIAFFSSGLCISIALFRYSSRIATVYSFDLIGASLGSMLVVPFMYQWSPMALVFVVSATAFVAALGFLRAASAPVWLQVSMALFVVASLSIGITNDRMKLVEISSVKSYQATQTQMPKPKTLYEKWSPVSRVAVEESQPKWASNPVLMATNDAGAPTVLWEFNGNYEGTRKLFARDSTLCAFEFVSDAKVLIVGVGGGRDVLMALATGQRAVTAVEINPLMGEIVVDAFADYIGRIFEDPRVSLHIQEGRNFIAASDEKYDLIEFSMIDSWSSASAAGAYVFNENSLYTIDAVEDFMNHLEPNGIISMTRYFAWGESLRLVAIFTTYLENQGLQDVDQRIMVIKNKLANANATVLLKNGRFTREEALKLVRIAEQSDSVVIHAPHVSPQVLAHPRLRRPFQALLDPAALRTTRQQFIAGYVRDISPPTDDRPFFFYTQRATDMLRGQRNEHAARRLALPVLYGMAAVFAVIGFFTIFVPLYLRSGTGIREAPHRLRSLTYFAMLGSGFMLVEISLIQRLTIFLGHPTWSFVVVLTTVLFASGLGSQFSARWSDAEPRVLGRVLAGLTLALLFYALVIQDQFTSFMWLGKVARISATVISIAPLAFLMGMCFPMGIQIVRRFHATLVPWGWGVNGAFSVFASILSIVLALAIGFRAAMLVGVACYAVAFVLIRTLPNDPAQSARAE